jgi:ribose transport system ATP-binding protein
MFIAPADPSTDVALEIDSLRLGRVGPVSLQLRRGEILGLVGLRGAGQDLIGRAVFGATGESSQSGSIRIDGRQVNIPTPADAMRLGVGFVSGKRSEESLAGTLSVRENVYPNPAAIGGSVLTPFTQTSERRRMRTVLDRYDIRPRNSERVAGTLSGGNQQKTILARWFEAGRHVLVLEEPTFGVDIGSKSEIYALLRNHAASGDAFLVVSSDFEEIAGICHRALVVRRGRIVNEVPKEELTVNRLTDLASGASVGTPRQIGA